jgi:hypothetical protein
LTRFSYPIGGEGFCTAAFRRSGSLSARIGIETTRKSFDYALKLEPSWSQDEVSHARAASGVSKILFEFVIARFI